MSTNTTEISDAKLWDACGNYCRASVYRIGPETFECYLHDFNDSVPRRYINTLGIVNNVVDHFLRTRKAAGFTEASNNQPEAWRA